MKLDAKNIGLLLLIGLVKLGAVALVASKASASASAEIPKSYVYRCAILKNEGVYSYMDFTETTVATTLTATVEGREYSYTVQPHPPKPEAGDYGRITVFYDRAQTIVDADTNSFRIFSDEHAVGLMCKKRNTATVFSPKTH